jgi:NitT/TauT family transport system substrate-binding protein
MTQMAQSRRRFLAALTAAGGAGLFGPTSSIGQEAPPETTTVRLSKIAGTCIAPQYLAEEFLRLEGFADVQYVMSDAGIGQSRALARGEVDFSLNFAAPLVIPIDAGEAISIIAGVHSGCFELFGNERIRSIADLKGSTVGVQGLGGSPHVFLAAMAANVGLDPVKDQLGYKSIRRTKGAFRARQDRCLSRLSAGAAGIARAQNRPRDRQ